jgi:hypothetical protein
MRHSLQLSRLSVKKRLISWIVIPVVVIGAVIAGGALSIEYFMRGFGAGASPSSSSKRGAAQQWDSTHRLALLRHKAPSPPNDTRPFMSFPVSRRCRQNGAETKPWKSTFRAPIKRLSARSASAALPSCICDHQADLGGPNSRPRNARPFPTNLPFRPKTDAWRFAPARTSPYLLSPRSVTRPGWPCRTRVRL